MGMATTDANSIIWNRPKTDFISKINPFKYSDDVMISIRSFILDFKE